MIVIQFRVWVPIVPFPQKYSKVLFKNDQNQETICPFLQNRHMGILILKKQQLIR